MPRISVCIPTYNRASVMAERLKRMAGMQNRLEIEIVISDNASPDHTREVAEEFRSAFAGFNYMRQPRLISPVMNFYAALRGATFDHLIVMGDDDCIIADNILQALAFFESEPGLQALIGNKERFNFTTEKSEGVIGHVHASERHDITIAGALFRERYFYEYLIVRREPVQRYYHNEGLSYPLGWKMLHCCFREGKIGLEPLPLIYKGNDPDRLGFCNYRLAFQDWARADSEYFAALMLPGMPPEERDILRHAMRMRTVRYASDARVTARAHGFIPIALHYAQKGAAYDYDTAGYPVIDPATALFERLAHRLAEMARTHMAAEIALEEGAAATMLIELLKPLVGGISVLAMPASAFLETDKARIAVACEYNAAAAARAEAHPSINYCAFADLLQSCLEKPSDYAALKMLLDAPMPVQEAA